MALLRCSDHCFPDINCEGAGHQVLACGQQEVVAIRGKFHLSFRFRITPQDKKVTPPAFLVSNFERVCHSALWSELARMEGA